MNQKFYLIITIFHLFVQCISTDDTTTRSDWWKEVRHSPTVTDYVPSGTVRSLINSTISGNEYWHTNVNGSTNRNETFNELTEPQTVGTRTKIIRKIKRTFKKQTNAPIEDHRSEMANDWKENIVEPSITLDHNSPQFTTTSSPVVTLQRASTSNVIESTASDIDNLITSKSQSNVKWDDDNEAIVLSRSPVFKTKMNNQENTYEKYASIMPLPPPDTQSPINSPTASSIEYGGEYSNNLQSSSHHSIVAPLSSSDSYFNFNSKIVHTQPPTRSSDGKNRTLRKKQTRNARKAKKDKPVQDFFLQADKLDKKLDDIKKTVDYTTRVNHEVTPKNNLLAHLLKNNPFAIPLGKRTYKATKKESTSTPATLPPTILTKRMQPVRHSTSSTIGSASGSSSDSTRDYTTPMSTLSNDNLDNINFKATPSKQEYTWGRRMSQAPKANLQLSKRNEWSGNDEQKDSINDKLADHVESDEESVENDENTNEDVEPINDVNDEFNRNLVAIRNEESPKFDVVTFKAPNKGTNNNQIKGTVKSLPIQIISWRQAITHRNKATNIEEKPFSGERLTSAKLTVSNRSSARKEQQVERERPSPKAFSAKLISSTKQPSSSTINRPTSSFKSTASPKLTSTTQALSSTSDNQSARRGKKTTRNPLNSFVTGRKNEAYIAPVSQPQKSTTKTKPAQLFQEYEDEKENFREELDDNFISRQVDSSSPKKESRVKYAKNQEFRKKSLNLIEDKNKDNSIDDENNDQTEATKPIPQTSFKCTELGYFSDVETGCTVFHICQENNRKDSFFCPPGTAFNQLLSVCDWQANVNCEASIRSKPASSSNTANSNSAFETLNNLRNNNYESDDSLEDQKKK